MSDRDDPNAVKTAPSALMTLAEAAHFLGMKGSRRAAAARLERYLRKREKIANDWITVDVGVGKYARPRVTVARLRQFCPELFDTRSEMTELLREHVAGLEDRLRDIERNEELLAGEIERLASGSDADDT